MTVKKTALSILMIAGFAFLFSHCGSQGKSEDTSQPKSQTAKSKQQPHSPQSPEPVSANITLIESTLTLSPGEKRPLSKDKASAKTGLSAPTEKDKEKNATPRLSGEAQSVKTNRPDRAPAGKIRILSAPAFAQIQVDGEEWGETPMTGYKAIPVGTHRIQLKHRNYPAKDTVVYVGKGASIKIKMNLKDVTVGKN